MHGHIPALDGLRGIAILLVLCRHTKLPPSHDVPSALLSFVQGGGWVGVDLFFVLSGFLISGILLDLDRSGKAVLAFYARRAIRIWPLYVLTVAIGLLVLPRLDVFGSISTDGRAWEWLLFVQNLDTRPNPPQLGILWSLAVEEQMYLGLPLLILFLPRRQLVLTLIAIVVLAPCWRIAAMLLGAPAAANYIFTPARADAFAVGSLLAVVARRGGVHQLGQWPWLIGAVCGAAFVGLGVSLYDFDPFQVTMQTLGYSVVALLFGAVLALAVQSARVGELFAWRPLRQFGRYSYAIYLFHFPLWLVLSPRLWQPTLFGSLWPAQLLATAVMIATCFVGGWLSWTLIERHVLTLKRFVPYAHAGGITAASADDLRERASAAHLTWQEIFGAIRVTRGGLAAEQVVTGAVVDHLHGQPAEVQRVVDRGPGVGGDVVALDGVRPGRGRRAAADQI